MQHLANKVRKSGFVPDYLVGIALGGLIPLALIAEELDIRTIVTFSAKSYRGTERGELNILYKPTVDLHDKKVLLVDEIADSGTTLYAITDILQKEYRASEVRTAVISYNTDKCAQLPDFYIFGDTRWIVFPWEKD